MSKIVSVHSFRGGTGKSNTSANLAYICAARGLKVGVVDTDKQSPWIHVLSTRNETMDTLRHWNQQKVLEAWQHALGSLANRPPIHWPEGQEEPLAVAEWAPLVDISEDDKEYMIKAELPEVKKEDVQVTAEEGTLTIMGERKFAKEEKGKKYHRVERAYGSFVRTFHFRIMPAPRKSPPSSKTAC